MLFSPNSRPNWLLHSRLADYTFHMFTHAKFSHKGPVVQQTAKNTPLPAEATDNLIAVAGMEHPALLEFLGSQPTGLLQQEVVARAEKYGPNVVTQEKPLPWWRALWLSYCNPFSLLLTVLAVISYFTSDTPGAVVIGSMITLATAVRFTQERKSHEAAARLKALITPLCTVLRPGYTPPKDYPVTESQLLAPVAGDKRDIPSRELVPGDIIVLSAGDIVPADVCLLQQKDLLVNESMLTGESLPSEKKATPCGPGNPLEMGNLCFMGTVVVSGTATAVVVATGPATYFGIVAQHVGSVKREPTQFQAGINSVSRLLLCFMAVMAPCVLLINGFSKGNWVDATLFALSVAVGLTPEMLPMIVSSTLAKGAVLLSREKMVVKRLDAIQDLGAMDTLCSDKTGTLTQGQITLSSYANAFGEACERPLELGFLNSFFQTGLKNQMDAAIVDFAKSHGLEAASAGWNMVDELPFDFTRRRLSVVLEHEGAYMLVCKGALEETLGICTQVQRGESTLPFTPEAQEAVRTVGEEWNTQGLRVVAIATKKLAAGQNTVTNADESGLTLVGYMAFLDPPKESSAEALHALQKNGVTIKILTGDNAAVSRKTCADVGLDITGVVQGDELEHLTEEQLADVAEKNTVFAKLSPLHKERLVRALRSKGHVVGFLGDGINDAPALHAADVGISVNTAVDVAKDAADLILLEKNLLILEKGVVEGRKVFCNMLKYIKMATSSNFGNVFSVLIASLFLPFLPMLPLHMLVQNLLYDFSQVAIPFDNVDEELLRTPQHWETSRITRFMVWFGPTSSVFDIATFAVLWFVFGFTTQGQQTLFQSGWFMEGLLSQTIVVHMIRTRKIPFLQSRASTALICSTLAIMAVGLFIPMGPFAADFSMQALPLPFFGWLAAIIMGYMILTQVVKMIYTRRYGWQ